MRRTAARLAALLLSAGCGGDGSVSPPITTDVALGAAQYALYTGAAAAGTLRFPAADASGAAYLVVGLFGSGDTLTAPFVLAGASPPATGMVAQRVPAPSAPPAPAAAPREVGAALQFHDAIRRMDAAAARASLGMPAMAPPARAPSAAPPTVGSQRTFKVCGNLNCDSLVSVTAQVQVVGAHSALYVDLLAPPGGFTLTQLQSLDAQFDTVLYPIDHAAFGAESDIDGNGVVLILLTPKVNALVPRPACQSSFVTGFFLGADIAPAYRTQYNNGEIFYGFVPDPSGLYGCPHDTTQVQRLIAPTFIHEFQHMISYNQHVLLRGGEAEVLWLNEAMSHLAEELGWRHYDSIGTASADAVGSPFITGDLHNAYQYLARPAGTPVVALDGTDSLVQRGAQWLFVRYLVDRFGPGTTQQLDQTSLLGAANVAAVTGTSFATLLGRWALALYVSDLPSFTPSPALTYSNWAFRTTFQSLNQQDPTDFPQAFPLVPATSSGGAFTVTGDLAAGSGSYVLVTQAASGAAFSVTFRDPSGGALPSRAVAELAVVRLR